MLVGKSGNEDNRQQAAGYGDEIGLPIANASVEKKK